MLKDHFVLEDVIQENGEGLSRGVDKNKHYCLQNVYQFSINLKE